MVHRIVIKKEKIVTNRGFERLVGMKEGVVLVLSMEYVQGIGNGGKANFQKNLTDIYLTPQELLYRILYKNVDKDFSDEKNITCSDGWRVFTTVFIQ